MAKIVLSKISTKAPDKLDKSEMKAETEKLLEQMAELQKVMYAERKHSLLVILQGMDASGKDGAIREVFKAINPAGINVYSFKKPTELEMAHDFLWRVHQQAPQKGYIQIFNRSHYEDVLIQRVHKWIDSDTVKRRFEHINHFEKLLESNNTIVLKFFMHVSPEKQLERLEERRTKEEEMFKYNPNDMEERKLWSDYEKAYEDVLEVCNHVPWEIVPTDNNWYKEYLIAKKCVEVMKGLNMKYPTIEK